MKRILIIGGSGFIGKNIAYGLSKRGYQVKVYDKFNSFFNPNNINIKIGDFSDTVALKEALVDIEIVVHLVSTTTPAISNENPCLDIKDNLINTINLLELMDSQGVKNLIFASTGGAIYGQTDVSIISELHATNPTSSYGVVKLAIEKYLEIYKKKCGLNYTILRFSNPYGEYQNPHSGHGAIATFVWRALNREAIQIWGDGEVARDFLYISDLVDVIPKVIEFGNKAPIYNIGSGVKSTLNEIIQKISDNLPYDVEVIYGEPRGFDIKSNCLDITLATKDLKWMPKIKIEEGIKKLINYYESIK